MSGTINQIVPEDTPPGIYTVTVEVRYRIFGISLLLASESVTVEIVS